MQPDIIDGVPTFDIDKICWEDIKQAAAESKWIPHEHYFMNDWVADVCHFLREGHETRNSD